MTEAIDTLATIDSEDFEGKWRTMWLLALTLLLNFSVWFSASAVVPTLTELWSLSEGGQAWLTMSVQIGFVVGAMLSAVLVIPDRIPARWLMTVSSIAAGIVTFLIPLLAHNLTITLPLRFLTGFFIAGVYPIAMKVVATWTKRDRGLAIGLVLGGLVFGTAAPHMLNATGGIGDWRRVLYGAGILSMLGGIVAALFVTEGPLKAPSPPFKWSQIGVIVRNRDVMLANLGYFGHMWELFAMYSWLPAFLVASFAISGTPPIWSSILAAISFASGSVGSLIAGHVADRWGRTRVTSLSLAVSGLCALTIGLSFGANPWFVGVIAVIWGFAIPVDSPQFSACVSELADRNLIGTALALQTSLGFLLTLITIRLVPPMVRIVGWEWAFSVLVIGPVFGIWAMQTLQRSPAAIKLANGNG